MKKHILLTTASIVVAPALFAQSGNVGIGTTAPAAKLHVKASNNQYFRISAPNDSIRLTVTDEPSFLGSNTDLRLRASNGSNTLTLSATPVNVVYDVLKSSKPLSLQSVNRIELRSDNNRIGFSSVGNDIARLYLGDFGLGLNFNTDTIQARMDVRTSATDATNAFRLRNSAYAPLLNILNNGNTGLGTSTPTAKLHVAGNVRIADGTEGLNKIFSSDANGTGSWKTPAELGMDSSGWALAGNSLTGSEILGSTNAQPLRIVTDAAERMRVTEAGNVGIGDTLPQTKLHIKNSAIGDHALAIGGTAPSIRLYGGDTLPGVGPVTFGVPYAKIGLVTQTGQFANSSVPGDLVIQTVDTNKSIIFSNLFGGGNGTEQMRLAGNGNLGIGTIAPTNKLDVNGTARIRTVSQAPNTVTTVPLHKDANGVVVTAPAAANYGATTFGSATTIAPAATGTILTIPAAGGSMYKLLVRVVNACGDQGVVEYFLVLGTTNNFYSIKPTGSIVGSNFTAPTFFQLNKSNAAVSWSNVPVCAAGGGTTNLNFVVNVVPSGTNFLINITNSGDTTPAYHAILTKMFD